MSDADDGMREEVDGPVGENALKAKLIRARARANDAEKALMDAERETRCILIQLSAEHGVWCDQRDGKWTQGPKGAAGL